MPTVTSGNGNVTLNGPCPTPTPTPTPPTPVPTPTTIYGRYLDCDDPTNLLDVSAPFGTTFPNVLKSGSICFEFDTNAGSGVNGSYTLYASFNLCLDCQNPPTPTPVPTPVPSPSCNLVNLEFVSSVNEIVCDDYEFYYINTSDFCTATLLYRTPNCDRAALAGYYNNGSFYRYWNGSSFTLSCTVTNCP
jgi:hypothetical protein